MEFVIVFAKGAGLIVRAFSKNEAWRKAIALGIEDEDIKDIRLHSL
jgi:hypothetical protein